MSLNVIFKSIVKERTAGRLLISSARNLTEEQRANGFVEKPTPYQKADRQCILCKNKIQLDYKNPRLLSQFVSTLTGQIFDKHITGLCEKQQIVLEQEIRKSRSARLMPIFFKSPKYNRDPPLFNPEKPQRPNPY